MPDRMTAYMSDRMPYRLSDCQNMTDQMADRMPTRMPDGTSEYMSGGTKLLTTPQWSWPKWVVPYRL